MVENRRDTGRWVQLAPSVYALPSNPLTWHRQVMAAMLAAPRSSVSGLAAAHLHELDGCRPVRPELTVPRGSGHRCRLRPSPSERSVRPDHAWPLPDRNRGTDALRLRRPARITPRHRRRVRSHGRTRHDRVRTGPGRDAPPPTADGAGRPGCGRCTSWPCLPATPTSVLEVVLYRLLADPRIPRWEGQSTPSWWPSDDERVDAHIPSWRLIVEADGRAWHTRRADFDRDRRRDHIALAHGHRTVRFTHGQLVHEADYVRRTLLAIGSTTDTSRDARRIGRLSREIRLRSRRGARWEADRPVEPVDPPSVR